ncbi:MFS domain-containing protein [Haematococcus lacustris]|uniref:MFS domain-containing protein n=1 Tax=Haematococcus lacustris TaxID=44745 RepID=A0A6A0AI07_HAELA|nr:MFS domain-containing protein [Haematococcus lacustris]
MSAGLLCLQTYVVGVVGVLAALKAVPPEARWLQWLVVAALGFCIYGPHVLIGLCGAELVSKSAVGASQGLLGLVAYMGAANAGVPLSWVVHHHGWDGYFTAEQSRLIVTNVTATSSCNTHTHTLHMA